MCQCAPRGGVRLHTPLQDSYEEKNIEYKLKTYLYNIKLVVSLTVF